MPFLAAYAANLVTIGGIVGAYAFFLGELNGLNDWFKAHQDAMLLALVLHFSIYAVYWKLNSGRRALRRRVRKRK